jgi:hypothetical protein
MRMLVVMLAMEVVLVGCPNDTTTSDEFKLDELLRTYMGTDPQIWGADVNKPEDVDVYFLDYSRFDAFKADLDAGVNMQIKMTRLSTRERGIRERALRGWV